MQHMYHNKIHAQMRIVPESEKYNPLFYITLCKLGERAKSSIGKPRRAYESTEHLDTVTF